MSQGKIIFIAVITVCGLVAFQNCGEMRSNISGWSDGTSINSQNDTAAPTNNNSEGNNIDEPVAPIEMPAPVPDNPGVLTGNFNEMDPFDYSLLLAKRMMTVQLVHFDYMNSQQGKAIAINAQGLGAVAVSDNEDDAMRIALQRCYALGGQQPCRLLAVGDQFASSSADLTFQANYTEVPVAPAALDAAALPFLPAAEAAAQLAQYQNAPSPKAMAIGLDGVTSIRAPIRSFIASADEAERLVLEQCELISTMGPCVLVAKENVATYNPANPITARIDYNRRTLVTSIPGMRDLIFNATIANYVRQLTLDSDLQGVIYIAPDGAGDLDIGGSINGNDALATCQNNNTARQYPCFRYANGLDVLPIHENLVSFQQANRAVHCEVIPRESCEAHASVGCESGMYNVYRAEGGVTQVTCPAE